jgi:hypothetical protein
MKTDFGKTEVSNIRARFRTGTNDRLLSIVMNIGLLKYGSSLSQE